MVKYTLPESLRNGRPQSAVRGMLAGAAGGLAGTFAMTLFQNALSSLGRAVASNGQQTHSEGEDSAPATVKLADSVSQAVIGREIRQDHKAIAGQSVHYTFGTMMGALYGVAAEYSPTVTKGQGTAFGAALMIGADEIGVPLAGLSKPPTEIPLTTHAYALASHIVYGYTCEQVRSLVRRQLR